MTAVVASLCAILFGTVDFLGGITARSLNVLIVTGIAALSGGVVLVATLSLAGGTASASAVLLGAVSGIVGAIGLCLLYAALARGPMSVLAPVVAVLSASLPMALDLVRGSVLAPLGYVAVGIALVAGVLLGGPRRRGSRPTVRAAWMAAAGLLLGAVLVLLDATPADSGLVPLVANRFATAVIMALCLVVRRAQGAPRIAAVPVTAAGLAATAAGVIDAVANGFTLFALRMGELTVVAAVISLSPAGTAVLAITVLRDRIAPLTLLGIALGVISAALFALG